VNTHTAQDLLSGFREQLAGVWEMEFRSSTFNEGGEVVDQKGLSYARFMVDAGLFNALN
jgi:hypothetical protein